MYYSWDDTVMNVYYNEDADAVFSMVFKENKLATRPAFGSIETWKGTYHLKDGRMVERHVDQAQNVQKAYVATPWEYQNRLIETS